MGRKIAFVGAGAVGGYAGAHMVQAGEDVTFIDPWPDHVEHMRKHGLRVTHAMTEPEFTVPVRALHVTDAQQLAKEKPVDIAFVCMKSYDTAWVLNRRAEPEMVIRSPVGFLPTTVGASLTNLVFGGPMRTTLFCTESVTGSILRFEMEIPGVAVRSGGRELGEGKRAGQ
jgi:hypothetical protein